MKAEYIIMLLLIATGLIIAIRTGRNGRNGNTKLYTYQYEL